MDKVNKGPVTDRRCDICDKRFSKASSLKRHLNAVHGILHPSQEPVQGPSQEPVLVHSIWDTVSSETPSLKQYVCSTCGGGHSRLDSLQRHVNRAHNIQRTDPEFPTAKKFKALGESVVPPPVQPSPTVSFSSAGSSSPAVNIPSPARSSPLASGSNSPSGDSPASDELIPSAFLECCVKEEPEEASPQRQGSPVSPPGEASPPVSPSRESSPVSPTSPHSPDSLEKVHQLNREPRVMLQKLDLQHLGKAPRKEASRIQLNCEPRVRLKKLDLQHKKIAPRKAASRMKWFDEDHQETATLDQLLKLPQFFGNPATVKKKDVHSIFDTNAEFRQIFKSWVKIQDTRDEAKLYKLFFKLLNRKKVPIVLNKELKDRWPKDTNGQKVTVSMKNIKTTLKSSPEFKIAWGHLVKIRKDPQETLRQILKNA